MSKKTISSRIGGVTISAPPVKPSITDKPPSLVGPPSIITSLTLKVTFREKIIHLKDKDGKPLLTSDEITKLEKIYLTNNDPFFRLSDETNSIIYEIISQIYIRGFTNIYNSLVAKKWINRSEYFLQESPEMELSRQKSNIDKEIFVSKVEASKGAFKCRRCGSEETISVEKQMRRADEPSTIKVTCLSCQNKWTE